MDEQISIQTSEKAQVNNLTNVANKPDWWADLQLLCDRGLPQAYFQKGQYFYEREDYTEAFQNFKMGADAGSKDSQYQIGVMLFEGLGTPPDPKSAIKMMRMIASSSDLSVQHLIPAAQFHLGKAFYEGFGIPPDELKAVSYWTEAAQDGLPSGSVEAMTMLGFYYTRGESLELHKAYYWHRLAAQNDSVESLAVLGVFLSEGEATKKDISRAFRCLKEASDKGSLYARGHLCYTYYCNQFYIQAISIGKLLLKCENKEYVIKEADSLNLRSHLACTGVALALFTLGRCLDKGMVESDLELDHLTPTELYSRAHDFDRELVANLHKLVLHGKI